jgi:hypothetical protein
LREKCAGSDIHKCKNCAYRRENLGRKNLNKNFLNTELKKDKILNSKNN